MSAYNASIKAVSAVNHLTPSLSPAALRRAQQSLSRANDTISAAAARTLLFLEPDEAARASEAAHRDLLTHWQPLAWALRSSVKRDLSLAFARWRRWRRPPAPTDRSRELMRHNFVKWRDFVYRRKGMRVLAGTVHNVAFRALTRPAFQHWRQFARWLALRNAAALAEWRRRELRERFDKWVQWTRRRIWLRRLLHRLLGASRTGMLLLAWQRWVRHTRFLRAMEIMQRHMRLRKAWVLWWDALRMSRVLAGMSSQAALRRYWQRWRAYVARRRRERYFRMLWAKLQRKAALRDAWLRWLALPPRFRPEFIVRAEDLSVPAPPSPASTASTLPEAKDPSPSRMRPALCACLRGFAAQADRYSGVPRALLRIGGHPDDPGGVHYRKYVQRGLMDDSPAALARDKRGHLVPCPVHGLSRGGAGRSALAQQAAANKRAAESLAAFQSMSRAEIDARRSSTRASRLRRQAEAASQRRQGGAASRKLQKRVEKSWRGGQQGNYSTAAATAQEQAARRKLDAGRRHLVGGRCSADEHMLRRLDAATEVYASVNRGRGGVFRQHSAAAGEAVVVPYHQVGPPGRLDWDESSAVWPSNEAVGVAVAPDFIEHEAEGKEERGDDEAPITTHQLHAAPVMEAPHSAVGSDGRAKYPPPRRSHSPPGGGPPHTASATARNVTPSMHSRPAAASEAQCYPGSTRKAQGWTRPRVPAAVAVSTDRWMEQLPPGSAEVGPSGSLLLRRSAPYAPLSQMRGQRASGWVDTFVQPHEVRPGDALRRSVDALHDLQLRERSEGKWDHK